MNEASVHFRDEQLSACFLGLEENFKLISNYYEWWLKNHILCLFLLDLHPSSWLHVLTHLLFLTRQERGILRTGAQLQEEDVLGCVFLLSPSQYKLDNFDLWRGTKLGLSHSQNQECWPKANQTNVLEPSHFFRIFPTQTKDHFWAWNPTSKQSYTKLWIWSFFLKKEFLWDQRSFSK